MYLPKVASIYGAETSHNDTKGKIIQHTAYYTSEQPGIYLQKEISGFNM